MKLLRVILNFIEKLPFIGPLILWLLNRLLRLALRVPGIRTLVNVLAIGYICTRTTARPRPFSLWSPDDQNQGNFGPVSDYTSWASLTNKKFSGRHLAPAPQAWVDDLPKDAPYDRTTGRGGQITALFERKGPMTTDRSSMLFMFFAQWFTDSVLRVDPTDRRKNTSNHDVDLCQIYGLDEATTKLLRSGTGGKLRSQYIGGEEYLDYLCESDGAGGWRVRGQYAGLPWSDKLDVLLDGFPPERREKLYATGLERGNSSIGYVALNTLFMREHNRICGELLARNPAWGDERIFQNARNINIVLLLKLVVEDYINHIVGGKLFGLSVGFAEYSWWYRTNWIAIEFDLLYRWHGLVPDNISIGGKVISSKDFRNNNTLFEHLGVASLITLASSEAAGKVTLHNTPSFLWAAENASIKMGRDFRLRSYNEYRQHFGMNKIKRFGDLTKDKALAAQLESLYGTVDKLEYVVGLFAEEPSKGALFGNLLNSMVAYDAFTQIFTNPLLSRNVFNANTFTQYGLELIETTKTIQDLVRRNVPAGARVKASLAFSPEPG